MKIERYLKVKWFDKKTRGIVYGIDIKMSNGAQYHVKDDNKPIFGSEKEITEKVNSFNLELDLSRL